MKKTALAVLAAILATVFAVTAASAQEAEPAPEAPTLSLPDLAAQLVGTANAAGYNRIQLDPESLQRASIIGAATTSIVAGFGCPEVAKDVADYYGVVLKVLE